MKKNRKYRLVTALLILVTIVVGFSIIPEYMDTHKYYRVMVGIPSHRYMLLSAIGLTTLGLRITKSVKSTWARISIRFSVLLIFSAIHIGIKGELTGAGFMGLGWKYLWVSAIAIVHLVSLHAVGSWISEKFLNLSRTSTHIILQMALGLVANILVMYILLLVGAMYAPVVWAIYVGMGRLIYTQKEKITLDYQTLSSDWSSAMKKGSVMRRAQQILLVGAIVYLLYGIQLAFIPYSTARDANHAYMFFPKIWADNHGLYRSNGPWTSPYIRYGYISQWFSSMEIITPITGLARDTMAVMMNFITSAVGLLVVGTVSLDAVSKRLTKDHRRSRLFVLLSGALLLLRLNSGMGAFLVFVDNKTDLGILLLVMVAMMSAFIFLSHIDTEKTEHTKTAMRYAKMSGFFFGIAFLGKPTAFIDIAGFLVMVVTAHIGIVGFTVMASLIIGVMALMQMRSTGTYLSKSAGRVGILGLMLVPRAYIKNMGNGRKRLRLLCVWGGVMVATIIIGKTPYLMVRANSWSASHWVNAFLLSKDTKTESKTMVATTGEIDPLRKGEGIRELKQKNVISPKECTLENLGVTMKELHDRKKNSIGGGSSEDNGRYVGYGQRDITPEKYGVWYNLLGGVIRSSGCYAINDLAGKLCEEQENINEKSIERVIGSLITYDYVKSVGIDLQKGNIFAQDAVKLLNEYRRSRVIFRSNGSIKVPYRWLVPLNVTFNRSLQNASSYYTDIGFVRLAMLLVVVVGFAWGVMGRKRKITALTGATLLVWCIWALVADGIVRYGMGMIIWTIIASVAVLVERYSISKKNAQMVFWCVVVAVFGLQRGSNMIRISSQGSGGLSVLYKQGIGKEQQVVLNERKSLAIEEKLGVVGQKKILMTQFPHYMPVINPLEDRGDEDGIFVAGTYLQYFLRNQSNIRTDDLVISLWEEMSDSDVCATYLRLRDAGYRTIIIDPNIATVVSGKGNESLKERFIIKENNKGEYIADGVISMLSRLVMAGYADIGFTNQIGIHYAYTLSSQEISGLMREIGETNEVVFRTRMAMLRFLPTNLLTKYYGIVKKTFFKRFGSYEGLNDLALMYGEKIGPIGWKMVQDVLKGPVSEEDFNTLTRGQKLVIYRYASWLSMANNPQQKQGIIKQVSDMINNNIKSSSQIMSFTLQ